MLILRQRALRNFDANVEPPLCYLKLFKSTTSAEWRMMADHWPLADQAKESTCRKRKFPDCFAALNRANADAPFFVVQIHIGQ